jgi:CubicO group peptidase (beta-lactamase class C family)
MKKTARLVLSLAIVAQVLSAAGSDERIVRSWIGQFSAADPFAAGEAVTALARIGSPAVDLLAASLTDPNADVRWCAAIAIGRIAPDGAQSIGPLTAALSDGNADVRWSAAIALGNFAHGARAAVPGLLGLLRDDDRDVRWAAYVSLTRIDGEKIDRVPEISGITQKLAEMTPRLMAELHVPGVSICVIKNNGIAWSKSFGVRDASRGGDVNGQTMFEACSMGKPVLAYLALKLVETGGLDLDRPLCDYLAERFVETGDDAKRITARMILCHTSGMPNWRKGGEERGGPLPVYFKPGTKFSYSGEGIYYLQRVLERITREPFESYARRNLFEPLGLGSTSYVWTGAFDRCIATGHDASGNSMTRSRYAHANGAYSLYTTPEDYAKFIIQVMKTGGSSLPEKLTADMLTRHVRMDVRDVIDRPGRALGLLAYRGLGWVIDSTISGDIVYHSGSNRTGFACYAQFRRNEGSGIVIMTNGRNGSDLWGRLISAVGDL